MRRRRVGDDSTPDGVTVVLGALRALRPAPVLKARDEADPDRLADALFDACDRFDGTRFLYYVTCLQIERLDELAREVCQQNYWVLDPHDIAEGTVVRLYTSHLEGTRKRPFRAWARRSVLQVAQATAQDPDATIFRRSAGKDLEDHRLLEAMARIMNPLEFEVRRIVWLAWVERLEVKAIAAQTGVPLERVEFLLGTLLERAMREMGGYRGRRGRNGLLKRDWEMVLEGRPSPGEDDAEQDDDDEDEDDEDSAEGEAER